MLMIEIVMALVAVSFVAVPVGLAMFARPAVNGQSEDAPR